MNKKQQDRERIQEIKETLKKGSTEKLIEWRNAGYLGEYGRIAIKQILKERNSTE